MSEGTGNYTNEDEAILEYANGLNYIYKIIRVRQVASEAIIAGMLDEHIYWLVRHGDFARDYLKLKDFMEHQYTLKNKENSYDRKAFRIIVHKWRESRIKKVINEISKSKWNKFDKW